MIPGLSIERRVKMKKLLVFLVIMFLLAAMGFTAFASGGSDDGPGHDMYDDKGGNRNSSDDGPNHDINDDKGGSSGFDSLEDYRERLSKSWQDDDLRLELMKKVVELRHMSGDHSIPVFIDGKEVKFDVPPVIKAGRTLIPVRAVTTALGAQVDWDDSEPNIVKITKLVMDSNGDEILKVIVIDLYTEKVTVNGTLTSLDVPPMLEDNRTMVPIRFVAETFNMKIDWNNYIKGIVVDK